MEFKILEVEELSQTLFAGFIRRQIVTDCWRREKGQWVVKADPFVDDWSKEDYDTLICCLKNTIRTGGFVYAA